MATKEELEGLLAEAQAEIANLNEIMEQLKDSPLAVATVIAAKAGRILLSQEGKLLEANAPKTFLVGVGSRVLVHPMTGGIVQEASLDGPAEIGTVEEVVEADRLAVVGLPGGQQAVLSVACKVRAGDRVMVQGSLVSKVLERKGSSPFLQPLDTRVNWSDVKGQAAAIQIMKEVIEWPARHKDLLKSFNRVAPKGLMLWGPPGCGKTLLAKAAATAMQKEAQHPAFFYVKGPELLRPYVGQAEAEIRELFAQARVHQKQTNQAVIIFVDEADAILPKRGSGISTDVMNTIVPQFLSEMDGLQEGGPFLLLATNLPSSLDPAVVRPGRIDHAVEIKRPDAEASIELFNHYLQGVPLAEPREDYGDFATARIFKREDLELDGEPLSEKLSGAFIAGVAKEAVSIAIRRNIESPKTRDKGLLRSDLAGALVNACKSRNFDAKTAKSYGSHKGGWAGWGARE